MNTAMPEQGNTRVSDNYKRHKAANEHPAGVQRRKLRLTLLLLCPGRCEAPHIFVHTVWRSIADIVEIFC